MKTQTIIAFALALALAGLAPLQAQDDNPHAGWLADFDKAMETAKQEKKDLLVDFTGSDWCGWCTKLKEEVFDHDEFSKAVTPHFVLVALDYPRGDEAKAKVPNPERNKELSEKYGVKGFPTILLMTSDGVAYGKTGYQEGGPAKYVEHLEKMRNEDRASYFETVKLADTFEKAEEAEKAELMAKAIETLLAMDSDAPGVESIATIVRTGTTSDDAAIKEKAVLALLKSGQGDEEIVLVARELDPKNEKGMLEMVVQAEMANIASEEDLKKVVKSIEDLLALGPVKDADLQKMIYANMAFWSHRFLQDAEKAKSYATKLKEIAGDDPKFARLFEMILGK